MLSFSRIFRECCSRCRLANNLSYCIDPVVYLIDLHIHAILEKVIEFIYHTLNRNIRRSRIFEYNIKFLECVRLVLSNVYPVALESFKGHLDSLNELVNVNRQPQSHH